MLCGFNSMSLTQFKNTKPTLVSIIPTQNRFKNIVRGFNKQGNNNKNPSVHDIDTCFWDRMCVIMVFQLLYKHCNYGKVRIRRTKHQ